MPVHCPCVQGRRLRDGCQEREKLFVSLGETQPFLFKTCLWPVSPQCGPRSRVHRGMLLLKGKPRLTQVRQPCRMPPQGCGPWQPCDCCSRVVEQSVTVRSIVTGTRIFLETLRIKGLKWENVERLPTARMLLQHQWLMSHFSRVSLLTGHFLIFA
jgi:hypothetical protein